MFIVLRRRNLAMAMFICCFLVVSLGAYSFAMHPDLDKWRSQGLVISDVKTSEKAIAITIDDGPNPAATPQVLDILQRNNAHATFFVLGLYAERYPELVKDIQGRGHEIGSHGYSHKIKEYNEPEFARSDIRQAQEVITRVTGVTPHLLRPPGGFLSRELVEYCQEEKLTIITWSWKSDYKDWRPDTNPSELAQQIVAGIEPGQILLLHDGGENRQVMVDALARALPELSQKGYRFVTVSELAALGKTSNKGS